MSFIPDPMNLEGGQVRKFGHHELEKFGLLCVFSVLKLKVSQAG